MNDVTVELDYRLEGPKDAPVLVMANSPGSTLCMWDEQATVLSERLRLLRYDHRGHEGSPVPSGPYRIEDLGRDVLALLDRLEIKRASFCGLSIGGMVGMWLASEAPDRLVLCCTSARFDPPEAWNDRARTVRESGVEEISDAILERWFTPPFQESRPDLIEWAHKMLEGTPAEGYAGCCEAIRDGDLRERLSGIQAPTLVIAGAEDPAAPVDQAEFIRDTIPNARLEVIERAAHLANVERPEAVTQRILAHFEPEAKSGATGE